jgi:hypothetical protein
MVDEYRGLRRVSHSGGWAGYRAELIRFPDQKLSVVTLCNLGTTNPTALAQQVADLYLADKLAPAEAVAAANPKAPASGTVDASRYTGVYWSSTTGFVRRILARDGKLFYSRGQDNESELAPLGGDRFAMLGVPGTAEVSFPSADPGAPRRMQVASGGKPIAFEEVQPASPRPEDLAAYAGTYTSAELDTTWPLVIEDGRLSLRIKRRPAAPLEPAFTDAFNSSSGLIRFQRDGEKKVTGFVVSAGRTRDLKFTKTSG